MHSIMPTLVPYIDKQLVPDFLVLIYSKKVVTILHKSC